MKAYERLLQYVKVNTVSSELSRQTPSSEGQWDLARLLETEMRELGLQEVYLDPNHAYVYGRIPATPGYESCKTIGFIAHMDTVDEMGERAANPQVIDCWDGSPIPLGTSGKILRPELICPTELKGCRLITTDGTSVLGADDKSGIAEILTLCEEVLNGTAPHGAISICFTPDEEIGHGAELLDMERFAADYAYTVDGCMPNEINCETFYAARADLEIRGYSVHPGDAKDRMINASLVLMELNAALPQKEIPACTSGREGFYHLTGMEGNVEAARASYILRDHDREKLEAKKEHMRDAVQKINARYSMNPICLAIIDQYKNMYEVISKHPAVLEVAKNAIEKAGLTPVCDPVRGGTDGARLSFRGLPCPNLGTGSYGFHGPYEFAVAQQMDQTVEILHHIIDEFALH